MKRYRILIQVKPCRLSGKKPQSRLSRAGRFTKRIGWEVLPHSKPVWLGWNHYQGDPSEPQLMDVLHIGSQYYRVLAVSGLGVL